MEVWSIQVLLNKDANGVASTDVILKGCGRVLLVNKE